jgi:hypothetical protein
VATASIRPRAFEEPLRRAGIVAIAARLERKPFTFVVLIDDRLSSWEARAAARIASSGLEQGRDTDLVLRVDLPPTAALGRRRAADFDTARSTHVYDPLGVASRSAK